jgi:hypothetical protein
MTNDDQDKMLRRYAAGEITWSSLRDRGFDNYLVVLAGLCKLRWSPRWTAERRRVRTARIHLVGPFRRIAGSSPVCDDPAKRFRFRQAFKPAYANLTFFSGRLRTGLPVAAWIAFRTAGDTTAMVGSPMPPQKS